MFDVAVIDPEKMRQRREESRQTYLSFGSVRCPYLNSEVVFNNKGFEHLRFKSKGKPRTPGDQYVRLRMIKFAPEILKKSHTLQECLKKKEFEQVNTNSKWNKRLLLVTYYGFVAVIESVRIKIIIKEVEGSEVKYFWSLIPFWKNDKKNDTKKILHTGNMEED